MKEIILNELEIERIGFRDADGQWCNAVFAEDFDTIADRIVAAIQASIILDKATEAHP